LAKIRIYHQVPEGVILEPMRKGMVVGEVIVADHQGFAAGTLFAMKLQEMGGTVLQAISKEAIMKTLQDATMMGRKITAVFVLDGMVSAQEALQVTGMYKTPFVQFGMQSQPREMFGEAYLMTPQVCQTTWHKQCNTTCPCRYFLGV